MSQQSGGQSTPPRVHDLTQYQAPRLFMRLEHGLTTYRRAWSTIKRNDSFLCRLMLRRTLEGHSGCVNTVSFTPCGNFLVSAGDDLAIKIWDWQAGKQVGMNIDSGHYYNVFQARMVPHLSQTIITSAADGQVRVLKLPEGAERGVLSTKLWNHRGMAHKLALADHPMMFLSCGEDGKVVSYDLRQTKPACPLVFCKGQSTQRAVELYSVHINPTAPWQFCVGGQQHAVHIFDLRMSSDTRQSARPVACIAPDFRANCLHIGREGEPTSCTDAVYSSRGEILATYNDNFIYLFQRDLVSETSKSASQTGANGIEFQMPSTFEYHSGRVLSELSSIMSKKAMIRKQRLDTLSSSMDEERTTFDAENERSRESARQNLDEPGVGLSSLDLTQPESTHWEEYPTDQSTSSEEEEDVLLTNQEYSENSETDDESIIYTYWDRNQSRRVDKIGGEWQEVEHGIINIFSGHLNQETIKGVSFLGPDDEWVVSGSDSGHFYVWSAIDGTCRRTLRGDLRVVNCLEPHKHHFFTLATSGIDHDIKIWEPTAAKVEPIQNEDFQLMERNRSYALW